MITERVIGVRVIIGHPEGTHIGANEILRRIRDIVLASKYGQDEDYEITFIGRPRKRKKGDEEAAETQTIP